MEVDAEEAEEEQVERLLDGVPLEIQEAWICEDLMFALQVGLVSRDVPRRSAED